MQQQLGMATQFQGELMLQVPVPLKFVPKWLYCKLKCLRRQTYHKNFLMMLKLIESSLIMNHSSGSLVGTMRYGGGPRSKFHLKTSHNFL